MNVLFLTMNPFTSIEMHNIYSDLMKEFIRHGHKPYIVTPREKRMGEETGLEDYGDHAILKVQTGNMSGVSLIEKGISTVTLSRKYYKAVLNHLGDIQFDLMLYSTPPITLVGPVKKLKRRFKATTYLMLKDIFPQNAVDLGMFSVSSPIYKYFRHQEEEIYKVSDRIGCMSPANVQYVVDHNPKIDKEKVEICANAIIPHEIKDRAAIKREVRKKYSIPDEAILYIYGGNLGKPQGIPFLIDCLKVAMHRKDCFFIVCGSGSEYGSLEKFIREDAPQNFRLINFLPKEEYDELVCGCDVGMIFLDHNFTIPNYPSRILSYMENSMPVLVCTDPNSDMGAIAEKNGFGLWCESNRVDAFLMTLDRMAAMDINKAGTLARNFLLQHYTADKVYASIMEETK